MQLLFVVFVLTSTLYSCTISVAALDNNYYVEKDKLYTDKAIPLEPLNKVKVEDNTVPANDDTFVPQDNSHYVEGKSRYIWMPDEDLVLHLVDLQANTSENFNPNKSGANNQYWLFTRRNPKEYQNLVDGDVKSVTTSNYLPNLPLFVIAHGWTGSGKAHVNTQVTPAVLKAMDANIIVLDWSTDAGGLYIESVLAVPGVGRHLGFFLMWLINNFGGDWSKVHLIGFSLGAHVVGNTGRTVGGCAARITGLDPAGPLWTFYFENALKSTDGVYVESIHTNAGMLGILTPILKSDFYVNGGILQPNCSDFSCSHHRSHELFASSIANDYEGNLCEYLIQAFNCSCTGPILPMGNIDFTKRGNGVYGLMTGGNFTCA